MSEGTGAEGSQNEELERDKRIEAVMIALRAKYKMPNLPSQVYDQLYSADKRFGGLDKLRGKRILDLGCGAKVNETLLRFINEEEQAPGSRAWEIKHLRAYDTLISLKEEGLSHFRTVVLPRLTRTRR